MIDPLPELHYVAYKELKKDLDNNACPRCSQCYSAISEYRDLQFFMSSEICCCIILTEVEHFEKKLPPNYIFDLGTRDSSQQCIM